MIYHNKVWYEGRFYKLEIFSTTNNVHYFNDVNFFTNCINTGNEGAV